MTAPVSVHPTVVAEAPGAFEAALWVDALRDAGIAATSYERSVSGALGGAVTGFARFPVVVPAASLGAARSILADFAGAHVLAPYRDEAAANDAQRRILLIAGAALAAFAAAAAISLLVR